MQKRDKRSTRCVVGGCVAGNRSAQCGLVHNRRVLGWVARGQLQSGIGGARGMHRLAWPAFTLPRVTCGAGLGGDALLQQNVQSVDCRLSRMG
jgi:hypothetical protein